ncbi:hypothetical protein ONZ45_g18566 [Pleurotus djamor]|nr:hypothetical protein ONZ45_g18566 [Pleurotus djamor]
MSSLKQSTTEHNTKDTGDDIRATSFALTPPIGTAYWKRVPFQWNIYVYVSSASPDDPDFTSRGGLVTILIAHSGGYQTNGVVPQGFQFLNQVVPSTPPSYMRQFPEEGELLPDPTPSDPGDWGVGVIDKRRKYQISYRESLPMFKNGGNDVFVFDASCEDECIRHNSTQKAEYVNSALSDVTLTLDTFGSVFLPIFGLSVFRYSDVKVFPVTFDFKTGYGEWLGPESVTIDLDFE